MRYTDCLLDIKHAVEEKHKLLTGVSMKNNKVYRICRRAGIPIWIRYVLVPYTDDGEDLKQAAKFIGRLKTVKSRSLALCNMGAYKWENRTEIQGVRT